MSLEIELVKRIFNNLGISPSTFGKAGISINDFITDFYIKIKEEDSNIKKYPIYAAKINTGLNLLEAAFIDISQDDENYYLLALIIGDNTYGLEFCEYNFECFILHEEKWLPTTILQKINIAGVIETITQYGLMWEPLKGDVGRLNNILNSLATHVT